VLIGCWNGFLQFGELLRALRAHIRVPSTLTSTLVRELGAEVRASLGELGVRFGNLGAHCGNLSK
jgi:hypothetical protein